MDDMLLTKEMIAVIQLDRAIGLFLDEQDYVSAITLAGASEEILCEMRRKNGDVPAREVDAKLFILVAKATSNRIASEKEYFSFISGVRNGLKHYADGKSIFIDKMYAWDIIFRAITDYTSLTEKLTDEMIRFSNSIARG